MAFDYSLRFTGQDDLSGILGKVKKEIKDMGKEASNVELVDKAMGKIITSSGKLNTKVRQTGTLLAEMKFDGDYNAEQFLKVAKAAGNAKDAIKDTRAVIDFFADDRRWLNFTAQGFEMIAGAGSVAAGALGLFGVQQEKVNEAILKCQSYLSVLNGIKSVATLLDKEGTIITGAKVLKLKALTIVQAASTAATRADTKATQYWNIAKAIGAALLGNWKALLIVGATALVGYATYTSLAAKEQEDLNEENGEGISIEKKAAQSAAEKLAKLRALYSATQDQTLALKDRNAAADELRSMNPDILSGLSNEAILAGDAADAYNDMADAIIRIAMAEAAYDRIKELTKELLDLELADKKFNEGLDKLGENRREAAGQYGITLPKQEKSNYVSPRRGEIQSEIDYLQKTYGSGIIGTLIGGNRRPGGFGGRYRRGGSAGGSGSTPPPSEEVKGIIANYEKEIQDLKKQINEATSEELIKSLNEDLKKKEAEFTQFKIDVGLEVDPKIAEEEEAKKKAEEIAKKLLEDFQASMNEVAGRYSTGSTFDKLIGDNPFNTNSLEGLKRMMDATENSLKGMYDLKKEFEDAGDTGSDAYQQIIDKIKELEEELAKLGIIVIETKEKSEKTKKIEDTFNKIGEAAGYTGQMFSSLGQMAEDNGLKAAGIIAETIAQLALGYAKATVQAADLGPWAWVAFGLAGAAQLAAMVAQIHSLSGYASGGIISGGSSYGDQILARVNAGEMVLNRKQQANLFRAIESGDIGAGNTVLVPEFKIKGSDLYGTLRNFSKSVGKTGKVTGIR